MAVILDKLKSFFSNTFYPEEDTIIKKSITKNNLPFFIGWIAIIFWLDCYVLPIGTVDSSGKASILLPSNLFSYLYPLAGTIVLLLLNMKGLLYYVKYSAAAAVAGLLAGIFINDRTVSLVSAVIVGIAFGHIVAATDFGFFMVMNNVERLYSVSIGILISKVLFLMKLSLLDNSFGFKFFQSLQVIGVIIILACTWFYKKSGTREYIVEGKIPEIKNFTVLILACFVFLFNDFIAPALWKSNTEISPVTLNMYHITGVFLGIVFIVILQRAFKINICYILNFSFATLALGFVVGALEYDNPGFGLFMALVFGISYSMGFISIYYMLGIISKRSRSMFFFKTGIISATVFYVLGFFITDLLRNVNSVSLYSAVTISSVIVILIIFALTPLLTEIFYSAEWTDDLYRRDVTYDTRLISRLSEFKLSRREIDVCTLLLEGYTMRQVSSILNIKYSTVNTYCTSLYRKLGINSRTELTVMFSEYLSKT
ncbi:MAG TPA: helix-turn-helix transcriptional regulator [Clostridiaceae bacterium]|nr:helix-turn-helix transcriptional regulator [Clostridiaceae bacterium]